MNIFLVLIAVFVCFIIWLGFKAITYSDQVEEEFNKSDKKDYSHLDDIEDCF